MDEKQLAEAKLDAARHVVSKLAEHFEVMSDDLLAKCTDPDYRGKPGDVMPQSELLTRAAHAQWAADKLAVMLVTRKIKELMP